jgi:hypothetical protein
MAHRSLELNQMVVDGGMRGCTKAGGFIGYDDYFHLVNEKKHVIIYHVIFIAVIQTANQCEFHGIVRQGAYLNLVQVILCFLSLGLTL